MINEDLAHQSRRDPEEMLPILPIRIPLIHQTQICLIHEGSRLQSMTLAFSPQITGGNETQLLIDNRREFTKRIDIALCPQREQLRHIVSGRHVFESGRPKRSVLA